MGILTIVIFRKLWSLLLKKTMCCYSDWWIICDWNEGWSRTANAGFGWVQNLRKIWGLFPDGYCKCATQHHAVVL